MDIEGWVDMRAASEKLRDVEDLKNKVKILAFSFSSLNYSKKITINYI